MSCMPGLYLVVCPEYAIYPFELLPRCLAAVRREAKTKQTRSNTDVVALLHDLDFFLIPTHNAVSTFQWKGSAAEQ